MWLLAREGISPPAEADEGVEQSQKGTDGKHLERFRARQGKSRKGQSTLRLRPNQNGAVLEWTTASHPATGWP